MRRISTKCSLVIDGFRGFHSRDIWNKDVFVFNISFAKLVTQHAEEEMTAIVVRLRPILAMSVENILKREGMKVYQERVMRKGRKISNI